MTVATLSPHEERGELALPAAEPVAQDAAKSDEPTDAAEGGESQTLSSEDVVEISKFNQGKVRIEEHTALLESRPKPQAFDDFRSAEGQDLSLVWADLDRRREEVRQWIEERNEIERQAEEWNVADMERLRRVSKAASERHMSPSDTDLVEIAMDTLVALDRLLNLLTSRRLSLDLLAARLEWEAHRRECWTTYHKLAADIEAFVSRRARWSTSVYSRRVESGSESSLAPAEPESCASSACSSPTKRRGTRSRRRLADVLNAEAAALAARIRPYAHEVVPRSAEALDSIIEEHKVPEEFLDEQDRLENLAALMTAQGVFLADICEQWHKADEIYNMERDLYNDAKDLTAALDATQTQVPDAASAQALEKNAQALVARLERLAGPSATRFVRDPSMSQHALRLSPAHDLVMPRDEAHWPDQEEHNAAITATLAKELASTAKHVRRAALSSQRNLRALAAFERVTTLQRELQAAAAECDNVKLLAEQGWPDEDVAAQGSEGTPLNLRDGSRVDLSKAECLRPYTHGLYASRFPRLKPRLATIAANGHAKAEELSQAILLCIREGLAQSMFRRDADQAVATFRGAQEGAQKEIARATTSLDALRSIRATAQLTSSTRAGAHELLDEMLEADAAERSDTSGKKLSKASLSQASISIATARQKLTQLTARSKEITMALTAFAQRQLDEDTSAVQAKMESDRLELERVLAEAAEVLRWLEAAREQRAKVNAAAALYEQLSADGAALSARLSQVSAAAEASEDASGQALASQNNAAATSESSAPLRAPALIAEETRIFEAVDAFISSMPSAIPFTGPAPLVSEASSYSGLPTSISVESNLTIKDTSTSAAPLKSAPPQLVSVDEELRERANGWCAKLASMKDQLNSLAVAAEAALARQLAAARHRSAVQDSRGVLQSAMQTLDEAAAAVVADVQRRHGDLKIACEAASSAPLEDHVATVSQMRDDAHAAAAEYEGIIHQAQEGVAAAQVALLRLVEQVPAEDVEAVEAAQKHATKALEAVRELEKTLATALEGAQRQVKAASDAAVAAAATEAVRVAEAEGSATVAPEGAVEDPAAALHQDADAELATQRNADADVDVSASAGAAHTGFPIAEIIQTPATPSVAIRTLVTKLDEAAPSLPRSYSAPAPSEALSASPTDLRADVFGPMPDSKASLVDTETSLRERIAVLVLSFQPDIVEEQTVLDGLAQKRRLLLLPSQGDADIVMRGWEEQKRNVVTALATPEINPQWPEVEQLRQALDKRASRVRRFGHLADFSTRAEALETELGQFVEFLDALGMQKRQRISQALDTLEPDGAPLAAVPPMPEAPIDEQAAISERLAAVTPLMEQASTALDPVSSDARVMTKMSDLNRLFNETRAMAREHILPPELLISQHSDDADDMEPLSSPASVTSSLPSMDGSHAGSDGTLSEGRRTPALSEGRLTPNYSDGRLTPSYSDGGVSRSASVVPSTPVLRRPDSADFATPLAKGKHRSVSEAARGPLATPRTTRVPSLPRTPRTPRPLSEAVSSPSTPRGASTATIGGHHRVPSVLSTPVGSKLPVRSTSSTSSRSTSRGTRKTTRPANSYRPNPKSKLDVAVSRIVNQMPVPVQIAHASTGPEARAQDTWNDESGRYWVGHRDPRLCFCRFLRSRIVMVRIGGGWQELSSYIQHHYSELAPQVAVGAANGSPPREADPASLPWMSSATLTQAQSMSSIVSASAGNDSSVRQRNVSSLLTPAGGRRSITPGGTAMGHSRSSEGGRRSLTPSTGGRRSITPGTEGGTPPSRSRVNSGASIKRREASGPRMSAGSASVSTPRRRTSHPFPFRTPTFTAAPQHDLGIAFPTEAAQRDPSASPEQMIPLFLRREDEARPKLSQSQSRTRSRKLSKSEALGSPGPSARARKSSAVPPMPSPKPS